MNLPNFSHKFSSFGFLYLILIFIVYSNSFHSSWHLDDGYNIRDNKNIQISSLNWKSIAASMHNPNKVRPEIHRPITRLTFAANWYLGKGNVFGYHLVNFIIHATAGWILYAVILLLFQSPELIKHDKNTAVFAAAFTASLWAIHPIQLPAVTYIVQRMASLAGLFYILSLFFYLKARLTEKKSRALNSCLSLIAYLLAVGSKQNAVLLPGSIILIELIFFRPKINIFKKGFFYLGIGLFTLLIILLLSKTQINLLQNLYNERSFTMTERVLTESRVLLFYLSQLIYPVENRFSIEHDITLSTSLFDPVTTILSVVSIIALIVSSLIYKKKFPFLSFALLFYFLNHIVESTILPLEIAYEHRNYIPSMFIFLPVAMGIHTLISIYKKNYLINTLLVLFIPLFFIFTGLATYTRNITWQNDEALWQDAMAKAPGKSRPLQNYSVSLTRGPQGKSEAVQKKLFEYNLKALEKLPSGTPSRMKRTSLTNMASSMAMQEKFPEALRYYQELLTIAPDYDEAKFNIAKIHLALGQNKKALDMAASIKTIKYDYQNIHALTLLKNKMPDQALEVLGNIRGKHKRYGLLTLVHMGMAYKQKNKFQKSRRYLYLALKRYPRQMMCYLFMIDVCGQMGAIETQKETGKKLLELWPLAEILKTIETMKKENLQPDLSFKELLDFLGKLIPQYYEELKNGLPTE